MKNKRLFWFCFSVVINTMTKSNTGMKAYTLLVGYSPPSRCATAKTQESNLEKGTETEALSCCGITLPYAMNICCCSNSLIIETTMAYNEAEYS